MSLSINPNVVLDSSEFSSTVQAFNKDIIEEWFAVNEYLESKVDDWIKLTKYYSLHLDLYSEKKDFALSICTGRIFLSLLQKSNIDVVNDFCKKLLNKKPRFKLINLNNNEWVFYITNSNYIYEKEIMTFKQPGVPEGTSINSSVNLIELEKQLEKSFDIISKTSVRIKTVVKNGLSCFVPLKLPLGMNENQCISFTARNAPGAIFISLTPMILLAESIIHESVHNIVYSASRIFDFVKKDSSSLVDSPLRSDKRPIYGVFHQAIVLDYLVNFYSEIKLINNHENITRNLGVINKREIELKEDLKMSINILKESKFDLSTEGMSIINKLMIKHAAN